jgi:hypothetical protein
MTGFLVAQRICAAQIYAQHNEGPGEKNMEAETPEVSIHKMAWAVLSRPVNGRSEVIKITDHEEADQTVQEHPELFYKSGPFMLAEPRLVLT